MIYVQPREKEPEHGLRTCPLHKPLSVIVVPADKKLSSRNFHSSLKRTSPSITISMENQNRPIILCLSTSWRGSVEKVVGHHQWS